MIGKKVRQRPGLFIESTETLMGSDNDHPIIFETESQMIPPPSRQITSAPAAGAQLTAFRKNGFRTSWMSRLPLMNNSPTMVRTPASPALKAATSTRPKPIR